MQKREHIELKLCPAEILDNGKVRIGALSPSFPAAPSSTGARGKSMPGSPTDQTEGDPIRFRHNRRTVRRL